MAAFFQGEFHLAVFYRYLLDIFRFPVLCVIRKQQQVIVVKFSLQCHKHLSRERAGSFGTQDQWFDCQLFDIILVLAVRLQLVRPILCQFHIFTVDRQGIRYGIGDLATRLQVFIFSFDTFQFFGSDLSLRLCLCGVRSSIATLIASFCT